MNREKEKLYRKENKNCIRYHGDNGSDYKYDRHTKKMNNFEGTFKGIKKVQRGMDYTPLYKFLLSKVGQNWDQVHSEAVSRLDKEDPIWNLVILNPDEPSMYRDLKYGLVGCGENSFYNSLTVNEDRILVKINPDAKPYPPSCRCCTHTFNGKVIPFIEEPRAQEIRDKLNRERNL